MKSILAVIGALALIVVILFGVFMFIGFRKIAPLTAEANAYADESIEAITATWDGNELFARSSPELRSLLGNGALETMMQQGEFQLGSLSSAQSATCMITSFFYLADEGEVAVADCASEAEFAKATASLQLNLVKRDEEWKILGFFVTPTGATESSVLVAYQPEKQGPAKSELSNIEISLSELSIGLTSKHRSRVGAAMDSREKIDNLN